MVLHYVEPWLSADIEAGERWGTKVAKELEATKFGICCITRENVAAPWVLFEAGALAKSMQEGRVVPLLLDVDVKDIDGPLAQFQAKKADKLGLEGVIRSINQYSDTKLSDARLDPLFETLWPALETKLAEIPKSAPIAKHNRPQAEVLEELVTNIRGLDSRFRDTVGPSSRWRRRKFGGYHPMMVDEVFHHLPLGRRDPLRLLIFASLLRDDFPWIYELGVDAYRTAATGPGFSVHPGTS